MPKESLSTSFYLFALISAIMALLVAGCGGESETGPDTTRPDITGPDTASTASRSKTEFIKRADQICEETKKKAQQGFVNYSQQNAVPKSGAGLSAKAGEFINTVFVPLYRRQIAQIEALQAPSGDRGETAKIIAAMRRGLNAGQRQPVALIRGAPFFREASTLATTYGLQSCTG